MKTINQILNMLINKIKKQILFSKYNYLIEPLSIFAAFFSLYNLTRSVNLAASHDSLTYLSVIEGSETVTLHPHHLLYNDLGKYFFNLWKIFGYKGDAVLPIQELNIIFACLTIICLYILFKKIFNNRLKSLIVCSAIALAYGFWFYTVTVEVYIIPLFFLVICFSSIYFSFKKPSLKFFIIAGVSNAFAILFHQSNILFIPTIIIAIYLNNQLVLKTKLKAIISYLICLIVPVGLAYTLALAYLKKLSSIQEAWYWLSYYSQSGAWGKFELLTPIKVLIGFGNVMIGAHFIFCIPYLTQLISTFTKGKDLNTFIFLVQDLNEIQAYTLLIGCIPLILVFALSIFYYIRHRKSILSTYSRLIFLCLSWFIPYALYFSWWEPANLEFWIAPSIPFWILICISFFSTPSSQISKYKIKKNHLLLIIAITCMFFVNLFGSILLLHSPDRDFYYQRSRWYSENTQQGDLIVCSRDWIWGEYLRRYTDTEVIGVSDILTISETIAEGINTIHINISNTLDQGGIVYITSDAVEPDNVSFETWAYNVSREDFITLWEDYKDHWYIVDSYNGDIVYILGEKL